MKKRTITCLKGFLFDLKNMFLDSLGLNIFKRIKTVIAIFKNQPGHLICLLNIEYKLKIHFFSNLKNKKIGL